MTFLCKFLKTVPCSIFIRVKMWIHLEWKPAVLIIGFVILVWLHIVWHSQCKWSTSSANFPTCWSYLNNDTGVVLVRDVRDMKSPLLGLVILQFVLYWSQGCTPFYILHTRALGTYVLGVIYLAKRIIRWWYFTNWYKNHFYLNMRTGMSSSEKVSRFRASNIVRIAKHISKELILPADVEGIKKLLRYQKVHTCIKTKYLGKSSSKSSETSNWRTYSFELYFIQVVIVNRSSGAAGGMKRTALKSTSSSALKWVQPKGSSPKACGSKRSQVENEFQKTVLDDLVFYAISHKLQPTYIDGAYIFSSLKRVHKEFSEKYTTQSVFQLLLISPQCISTLNEQIPTSQCTWNPQKVTNLCERLIKTLYSSAVTSLVSLSQTAFASYTSSHAHPVCLIILGFSSANNINSDVTSLNCNVRYINSLKIKICFSALCWHTFHTEESYCAQAMYCLIDEHSISRKALKTSKGERLVNNLKS